MNMFKYIVLIITFLSSTVISDDSVEIVDILKVGSYNWDGFNEGNVTLNIIAEGHYISVTIESCNIGKNESRPNGDYLILRQGNNAGISTEVGKRFAYIKSSKKLYFYCSSVILELKVSEGVLTEHCKVSFEKGDEEDSTLPPATTTETTPSVGPEVSKYSTVFISGKQIEDFETDKELLETLKKDLVKMAVEYTKINGFCLSDNITISNIQVYTLEQCPMKWNDYENCVRLVYSLPVNMKDKCPKKTWRGYQLTKENLDTMWDRMADEYLSSIFHVYKEPELQNVITWWIILSVLVVMAFSLLMVVVNVILKNRGVKTSRNMFGITDTIKEARRGSDESMSIPAFQTPPMFGELHSESNGTDNEGFIHEDDA